MLTAKGIDISEEHGAIDLISLKPFISFVIIRCGYGSDFAYQDDMLYAQNVEQCELLNLPFGISLYSYAQNEEMAKSEANHALRLAHGKKLQCGIWYDVGDINLPRGERLAAQCLTFCNIVAEQGYICGIYATKFDWTHSIIGSKFMNHKKWIAHWADKLDTSETYSLWQYASDTKLLGQRVGINYASEEFAKQAIF